MAITENVLKEAKTTTSSVILTAAAKCKALPQVMVSSLLNEMTSLTRLLGACSLSNYVLSQSYTSTIF